MPVVAGQGASRLLYTVPNTTFIEQASGDTVVTINDNSGSISPLQTAITSARSTNSSAIIVIHLLSNAVYSVSSVGLVLSSHECLVASAATIKAASSSVTVPLIQIASGSTNVSVAGGTLDGNGAAINGIYAPAAARVNIDKVIVQNCGLDCILLYGNGNTTYDNEMSVARCDCSGSPTHAGISIQNCTQAAIIDNNCHDSLAGIWLSCAWATVANNTCYRNTTGIDVSGGDDNAIANNTCNNNGVGIHAGSSNNMITSNATGNNSTAGMTSDGSGNNFIDNLFTSGNATNFTSAGSGNHVVAYQGTMNAPGQDYFYPPLINDQHTNIIVNGMGRTDLTITTTNMDGVQSQYNNARSANPDNVIVLHLNGTFIVGATPLTLQSNSCVLLNGMIQINSSTAASAAIAGGGTPSHVSISGGVIDGSNLTGNNGVSFIGGSMLQLDAVRLQNFGPDNPRVGSSDVVRFTTGGGTPQIVTRCFVTNGAARGIWLENSGTKRLVSDCEVTAVNQDGVDCDASTSGSVVKFNYCHDLVRYGVFLEQSAAHNVAFGNICNNTGRDINLYNNSATPRSDTQLNSVICNWCLGNNGIRNGSTGTNVVQTSHNFIFNNVVINATITSETYGTQNYYSQNYLSGGSLSTAGSEAFFNSSDVDGFVPIQDANSGLLSLVKNAATTNGAPVVLGSSAGLGNDLWQFVPVDSGFCQIKNKKSGLDMAVLNAVTNSGAPVVQWAFGSSRNDQWQIQSAGNGLYNFVNRLSSLYLDVPGGSTSPGTQLDQQSSNGLANQQFNLGNLAAGAPVAFFSISNNPSSRIVLPGTAANFTVSVSSTNNFSGNVSFSISGLPASTSALFNPPSLTGVGSSTLTITASNSAPFGSYALNIIGASSNLSQMATATLTVGDFSLSAAPPQQSLIHGSNAVYSVAIVTNSLFTGSVTLSASNLPPGATANFNPPSFTSSGTSTLTVATSPSDPGGNYTLIINASGGASASMASTQVGLFVSGSLAAPGTLVWLGGNGQNWSSALNWTNSTSGGNGSPGISNDVQFANFATTGASNVIDNLMDSSTAINSLSFSNTAGFHTTQILPGATLTVVGSKGLTVGTESDSGSNANVYVSITGAGGAVMLNNAGANLIVRQGTSPGSGSQRASLDLSTLDMFTAALNQISVGVAGPVIRSTGTLLLARTNRITASASPGILVGDNGSNSGGQNYLFLGQSNAIFAGSITIARQKATATLAFNFALSNSSALFRAADGVSRMANWNIGDNSLQSTSSSNSRGTNDFTGGTVDALVDSLVVGKSQKTTGADSFGSLSLGAGNFDVNTLQLGFQAQSGATSAGNGVANVNSSNGTLVVNTILELAHTSGGAGTTNTTGVLNVNGGTIRSANTVGGGGPSSLNLNSGTFDAQGGLITNISFIAIGATGLTAPAGLINAAAIESPNPLVIASNGTLAGNPLMTVPVLNVNGTISPGVNGVGTIKNSGSIIFGAGGVLAFGISDAMAEPGSGWDVLRIATGGSVQATTANPFTIAIQSLSGGQPGEAANFDNDTNNDWAIAVIGGSLTNFGPSRFAENNDLFVNDMAGGYFFVQTNGGALVLSFTNNHPPASATATYTSTGQTLAIPISNLATNWTDPDGDPITLVSVADSSANGQGNLSNDGNYIYYIPPGGAAPDSIQYTISDVRTNPPATYRPGDSVRTATGLINIIPSSGPPYMSNIVLQGGKLIISGTNGSPGAPYYVISTTNVTRPVAQWTTIATSAFDQSGNFTFTNTLDPSAPQHYFRIRSQ